MQAEEHRKQLQSLISKYIADRREYMRQVRAGSMPNFDFEYVQQMISIGEIGESGYLVIEEIKQMLLNEDGEISSTARCALQSMGKDAAPAIPEMFEAMKKGVNEYPFKIGEILASLVDDRPEIIDRLKVAIKSDYLPLLEAVIQTFYILGNRSIVVYDDLLRIIHDKRAETKGFAIRAIGLTQKQDDILFNLLIDFTQHSEWYLRGYAICALSNLKMSPDRCLPIFIDALDDDEGHDWTVRDAAVEAVASYGEAAAIAVPNLQALRAKLKLEDDYDREVKRVSRAIGKIKGIYPKQ